MKELVVSLLSLLNNVGEHQYQTQAEVSTYELSALSGTWELDLNQLNAQGDNPNEVMLSDSQSDKQCTERYNFGVNNQMLVVSDKEWTYGKYTVVTQSNKTPILIMITTYDNNEVDCSGNQVDQSGNTLAAYLKHEIGSNHFQLCEDKELKKCNMSFTRLMP